MGVRIVGQRLEPGVVQDVENGLHREEQRDNRSQESAKVSAVDVEGEIEHASYATRRQQVFPRDFGQGCSNGGSLNRSRSRNHVPL